MDSAGSSPRIPVFDGHNDLLARLYLDPERDIFERDDRGHLDLPRMREGGFAGGMFAVFPPPGYGMDAMDRMIETTDRGYRMPPAPPLDPATASRHTMAMIAKLFELERAADGDLTIATDVAEIEAAMARGSVAAVLHIEGAEAIGEDLCELEVLVRAGLRSLGVVWSRPNRFATGVPFDFPGSPDIGSGLTIYGRELVRACNRLGVLIDLSHLNEAGFWDVAKLSDAPLVATHSNAHALCPTPRNLTDAQLAAIRESDGLVGLNFAVSFLRDDGRRDSDTPLETMLRHIDHLVDRLGIDRVGFGSDFDGAIVPNAIGDASGLPRLLAALAAHGYDREALEKLAWRNWLRVLRATWG